jgi:hypothetical protein
MERFNAPVRVGRNVDFADKVHPSPIKLDCPYIGVPCVDSVAQYLLLTGRIAYAVNNRLNVLTDVRLKLGVKLGANGSAPA